MSKPGGDTPRERVVRTLKSCRDIMRKDKGLNSDLDRLPQLTWMLFLKFLDDLEIQDAARAELAGHSYKPLIPEGYRWRDWAGTGGPTGDDLIKFVSADEIKRGGEQVPGLLAQLRSLQGGDDQARRDVVSRVFGGVINRMTNGYLLRDIVQKIEQLDFASTAELHTLSGVYESMLREIRDAAGNSGEFYTPRPLVKMMVEALGPRLGETILDPACGTAGFLVEAYDYLDRQVTTTNERETLQRRTLFGGEAKTLPYLLAEMNLLLHGVEVPNIHLGNALAVRLTEIGDSDRVDVILTNPPFGGEEEDAIRGGFPPDKRTSETALLFLQLIMRKLRRRRVGVSGGRAAVVVPNGTLYESGVASRIRESLMRDFRLEAVLRLPKGVFEPYTDIQTNVLFFSANEPSDVVRFYEHPLPAHRAVLKGKTYSASDGLRYEELLPFLGWFQHGVFSEHSWEVPVEELAMNGYDLALTNPALDQRRGVEAPVLVTALASQRDVVGRVMDELVKELGDVGHQEAPQVRLDKVLKRRDERLKVADGEIYTRPRVRLHFRGAVVRDRVEGVAIGSKNQTRMYEGDLIVSRIDARNGAMALVPQELDGAIATGDFPVFEIDTDLVDSEYLRFALFQPDMLRRYEIASRGSTNRRRLDVGKFLGLLIPLPAELSVQREVASRLRMLQSAVASARETLAASIELIDRVLPAALHESFNLVEETTAGVETDPAEELDSEYFEVESVDLSASLTWSA